MSLFGRKEEAYEFQDLDALDESLRDRHWTIRLVLWVLRVPVRLAGTIKGHPRTSGGIAAFLLFSVFLTLRFGFVPTVIEEPMKYPGAPVGTRLARALQQDINAELDHGAILWGWVANGWTSNSYWPYPRVLFSYRDQYQRGKQLVWKLATRELMVEVSQQGRSTTPDANLQRADNKIGYDIDLVFAYPSVAGNLGDAADALGAYADALPSKRNFYPTADILGNFLQGAISYPLNLSLAELSPRNKQIGWMMGYVPFQEAQGRIHAALRILLTIEDDFGEVFDNKANSRDQLKATISALRAALGMSPWFVCNREWNCFGYSDVTYLYQSLSDGERELSQLIKIIRGNQK